MLTLDKTFEIPEITDSVLSEQLLAASICRESFYDFVLEFWDVINEDDFIDNWHIKYLCQELQIMAERVFEKKPKLYDLIINISPGSSKSTICSIMFPAWVWTRMAHARVIGASYTAELARLLSLKNRDIVLSEKYTTYFPEIKLRRDQAAKSHYINTRKGSRYSVGVGGSVTGMHGDFLLVDDPLNPNEAASEAELKAANRWTNETLPTRKTDKKVVPIIMIMQRLHQDDCTGHRLEYADKVLVKHICIPGELTEDVNPPELAANYSEDGLFDTIRFPREVLDALRAELLPYGFAGQILQTPIPEGGAMFKIDKINVCALPDKMRWKQRCRYWDKAASQDRGRFTVGALLGQDYKDRYWILDIVRGQWSTEIREKMMKDTADRDGRKIKVGLEQEPGSGGVDSIVNTIKNLAGYIVKKDKPTGDKTTRGIPFSQQVNIGNVFMINAEWNKTLTDELKYFPESKYKDQEDALAGAFNMMTKPKRRAGAMFHGKGKTKQRKVRRSRIRIPGSAA